VGMILSHGDATGGHQERYAKRAGVEPRLAHDCHPLSRTNARNLIVASSLHGSRRFSKGTNGRPRDEVAIICIDGIKLVPE
jgi:hypothetical protein